MRKKKKVEPPGLINRLLSRIVPDNAESRAIEESKQLDEKHKVAMREFDLHKQQCDACFREEGSTKSGHCRTGQKLLDKAESLSIRRLRLAEALAREASRRLRHLDRDS